MTVAIYEDDDLTLVSDLAFTNVQAGADSDVLEVHVWNEKGNGAGQALVNGFLAQMTESLTTADLYLATGLPPQDELWGWARIVGYDNTGDSSWSILNTDWVPMGAYSLLALGDVPANCAVYVERKLRPPSSANPAAYTIADVVVASEAAKAVPLPLTHVDRGIVTFAGVAGHQGVISGCEVTASAVPDDEVHVAPGFFQIDGTPYAVDITADLTLDQDDSAAATLASGESYWAAVVLSSAGAAVVKGVKAVTASAVKPDIPAGSLWRRWVIVAYNATGTEIETGDLSGDEVNDRFFPRVGSGVQAIIDPGDAFYAGTWRFHTGRRPLVLTDDSDNWVWQVGSGGEQVTTTNVRPDASAMPLAKFNAAGGVVTLDEDLRPYAGKLRLLRFIGDAPAVDAQLGDELMVEDLELHWEGTAFRIDANHGSASAGQTQVDVFVNGTTAYPNSATEDNRPAVAWDATELVDRSGVHATTVLRRGDIVHVEMSEEPTGGTPARLEVILVCRVP